MLDIKTASGYKLQLDKAVHLGLTPIIPKKA